MVGNAVGGKVGVAVGRGPGPGQSVGVAAATATATPDSVSARESAAVTTYITPPTINKSTTTMAAKTYLHCLMVRFGNNYTHVEKKVT